MIKANELRIGNLVKCRTSNDAGIYIVKGIHFDSLKILLSYPREEWYEEERLKPIPITEEWLLKFGFELDESENTWYFYNNEIVSFGISNVKGKWEFYLSNSPVDYLHQVQNLFFALVGEELTLKD